MSIVSVSVSIGISIISVSMSIAIVSGVTIVTSKVTGESCVSRVSSISTMTVVTVKVVRSSKDRGGYGSGESVHNRGNGVHGGNGQRNFSIGVFVEGSLEGSLGVSNIGGRFGSCLKRPQFFWTAAAPA